MKSEARMHVLLSSIPKLQGLVVDDARRVRFERDFEMKVRRLGF